MTRREDITEDIGNGALYAPPIIESGKVLRGVLSCDKPEVLKYIDRDRWVVLHQDHYARIPPELTYADLYQIDRFFDDHMRGRPHVHAIVRDFTDPDVFRPLGTDKRYDVILNSAWVPLKRHELLIEGLIHAKRAGRPITALLLGYHFEGYTSVETEMATRRLIASSGLDVDILDTDWNFETVNKRYNMCRCAVHTSSQEAGPKILPEATLAGLPYLAASDTYGGSPDYVGLAMGNGVVFDPHPQALASAIWWTLDNLEQFQPRNWALANMCKPVAEQRLRLALTDLRDRRGLEINIDGVEGTIDMDYAGVFEADAAART
jgi:glycosyltransferase involved in cell wall biosynthesis